MRFLFVDRILQLSPAESIRGIKHITIDDGYLYQNEAGKFVFPPSLIGETLGQLAAWNVMAANDFSYRPVAGVVASATMHRPAFLGETLILESFIDCLDERAVQYHSQASIGDERVFTVQGALGPLLPMKDFITEEEVKSQFNEIYRPGEWPVQFSASQSVTELVSSPRTAPLILSFDRIIDAEPGISLTAEKRISGSAPWFPDHFPNNPVLPMTILLECKMNLAKIFLTSLQSPLNYHIVELRKIKMNEFVHPGDILVCQLQVKKQDNESLVLSFRSEVNGKRVCVLEMVLAVEDKEHA